MFRHRRRGIRFATPPIEYTHFDNYARIGGGLITEAIKNFQKSFEAFNKYSRKNKSAYKSNGKAAFEKLGQAMKMVRQAQDLLIDVRNNIGDEIDRL